MRVVIGVLESPQGLFLGRRKSGSSYPRHWEFPGGKVEEGESDEQALVREWKEEFGLEVQVGDLVYEGTFMHRDTGELFRAAAYWIYVREGSTSPRMVEHSAIGWYARSEIDTLGHALTPTFVPILKAIQGNAMESDKTPRKMRPAAKLVSTKVVRGKERATYKLAIAQDGEAVRLYDVAPDPECDLSCQIMSVHVNGSINLLWKEGSPLLALETPCESVAAYNTHGLPPNLKVFPLVTDPNEITIVVEGTKAAFTNSFPRFFSVYLESP